MTFAVDAACSNGRLTLAHSEDPGTDRPAAARAVKTAVVRPLAAPSRPAWNGGGASNRRPSVARQPSATHGRLPDAGSVKRDAGIAASVTCGKVMSRHAAVTLAAGSQRGRSAKPTANVAGSGRRSTLAAPAAVPNRSDAVALRMPMDARRAGVASRPSTSADAVGAANRRSTLAARAGNRSGVANRQSTSAAAAAAAAAVAAGGSIDARQPGIANRRSSSVSDAVSYTNRRSTLAARAGNRSGVAIRQSTSVAAAGGSIDTWQPGIASRRSSSVSDAVGSANRRSTLVARAGNRSGVTNRESTSAAGGSMDAMRAGIASRRSSSVSDTVGTARAAANGPTTNRLAAVGSANRRPIPAAPVSTGSGGGGRKSMQGARKSTGLVRSDTYTIAAPKRRLDDVAEEDEERIGAKKRKRAFVAVASRTDSNLRGARPARMSSCRGVTAGPLARDKGVQGGIQDGRRRVTMPSSTVGRKSTVAAPSGVDRPSVGPAASATDVPSAGRRLTSPGGRAATPLMRPHGTPGAGGFTTPIGRVGPTPAGPASRPTPVSRRSVSASAARQPSVGKSPWARASTPRQPSVGKSPWARASTPTQPPVGKSPWARASASDVCTPLRKETSHRSVALTTRARRNFTIFTFVIHIKLKIKIGSARLFQHSLGSG